jgi:hypothetical protein
MNSSFVPSPDRAAKAGPYLANNVRTLLAAAPLAPLAAHSGGSK